MYRRARARKQRLHDEQSRQRFTHNGPLAGRAIAFLDGGHQLVAEERTKVRGAADAYGITNTDLNTPTWMRAPGAVSGMFALECAMDELAYALKIDPLELRLINYADYDPQSGKPWSSKALRECYRLGAEKFGWSKRKYEPRSMRDGRLLVGRGTATGVWGAFQAPASAKITYRPDGSAHVASATSDIAPAPTPS